MWSSEPSFESIDHDRMLSPITLIDHSMRGWLVALPISVRPIAIESFAFRPCLRAASSALSLSMNYPIGSTEVVRTSGSISTLMSRAVTIALFLAFTE